MGVCEEDPRNQGSSFLARTEENSKFITVFLSLTGLGQDVSIARDYESGIAQTALGPLPPAVRIG